MKLHTRTLLVVLVVATATSGTRTRPDSAVAEPVHDLSCNDGPRRGGGKPAQPLNMYECTRSLDPLSFSVPQDPWTKIFAIYIVPMISLMIGCAKDLWIGTLRAIPIQLSFTPVAEIFAGPAPTPPDGASPRPGRGSLAAALHGRGGTCRAARCHPQTSALTGAAALMPLPSI